MKPPRLFPLSGWPRGARVVLLVFELVGIALLCSSLAWADERTQRFDRDPGWDGQNYRPDTQLRHGLTT